MEWTDSAFVLEVGRMREADLWLRLLTPARGIVSAFAFGGCRSRKRFCGCLDVLNLLRVRAKATRNGAHLSLQEGVLLGGPRRLRTDRRRLGMAVNCVRFLEALGVAADGGKVAFCLLRDLLTLLENAEDVPEIIPALFRLRSASDQGYAPSFSCCSVCAASAVGPDTAFFSVTDGVLVCADCASSGTAYMELSGESLDVLRKVQEKSLLMWNIEEASPATRRACARLADGFVQYHLGLFWERGRFRRN